MQNSAYSASGKVQCATVHSLHCWERRVLSCSSVYFPLQLHIYRRGSSVFKLLMWALCRSAISGKCVSAKQIAAKAHGLMPLVTKPTINSSPTCNDRKKLYNRNNKRACNMTQEQKWKKAHENLLHLWSSALRLTNINPRAACVLLLQLRTECLSKDEPKKSPTNTSEAQRTNTCLLHFKIQGWHYGGQNCFFHSCKQILSLAWWWWPYTFY